jgi:hypothetical protein
MNMHPATILGERLRRQRLVGPAQDEQEYLDLFRLLQPVFPIASSRPGDPPRLVHRAAFDDAWLSRRLRARRALIKGRFLGGSIAYVLADDLDLYANAFQRPLTGMSYEQETVLEAIHSAGPLTPRQLKEETGLLNKKIMPALHRLQKAFLVYEDQVDDDWERSWYVFAEEWSQVQLDPARQPLAVRHVLRRFLEGHVFATFEQIKDWSQLPTRLLKRVLADMMKKGNIVPVEIEDLGEGWMCAEEDLAAQTPPKTVYMLHRADILARSHGSELKRRFAGLEVLQYLLIDGAFRGAVVGHWRIGAHDVDDIALVLPERERDARRDEILAAVAQVYHPPRSRIVRYAGRPV